jgi:hypothetical protein
MSTLIQAGSTANQRAQIAPSDEVRAAADSSKVNAWDSAMQDREAANIRDSNVQDAAGEAPRPEVAPSEIVDVIEKTHGEDESVGRLEHVIEHHVPNEGAKVLTESDTTKFDTLVADFHSWGHTGETQQALFMDRPAEWHSQNPTQGRGKRGGRGERDREGSVGVFGMVEGPDVAYGPPPTPTKHRQGDDDSI